MRPAASNMKLNYFLTIIKDSFIIGYRWWGWWCRTKIISFSYWYDLKWISHVVQTYMTYHLNWCNSMKEIAFRHILSITCPETSTSPSYLMCPCFEFRSIHASAQLLSHSANHCTCSELSSRLFSALGGLQGQNWKVEKPQRAETRAHLSLQGLVFWCLKADSISCGGDTFWKREAFLSLVFLSAYFCPLSLSLFLAHCLLMLISLRGTQTQAFQLCLLAAVCQWNCPSAGRSFYCHKKSSHSNLEYYVAMFECLIKDRHIRTQQDTTDRQGRRKLSFS